MNSGRKSGQNSILGVVGFAIFFATIYFSLFDRPKLSKGIEATNAARMQKITSYRKPSSINRAQELSNSNRNRNANSNFVGELSEEQRQKQEEYRQTKLRLDECNARIELQGEGRDKFLKRVRSNVEEKIGSWLFDPIWKNGLPSNEKTIEGKFLLGLAYAGLLEGLPEHLVKIDYERSISLLDEVSKQVPLNSAPQLYLALVYQTLGRIEKAQITKANAFKATYFESYEMTAIRTFWDLVETTSDLSSSMEYWSNTPIPDYIALRKFLIAPEDAFFAHLMLKESLDSKNLIEGYHWSALRHQFGKIILKNTTGKDEIPHFKELLKTKYGSIGLDWDDSDDFTEKFLKSCDISIFEGDLAILKQHRHLKPAK